MENINTNGFSNLTSDEQLEINGGIIPLIIGYLIYRDLKNCYDNGRDSVLYGS